jgi:hypothetical protein
MPTAFPGIRRASAKPHAGFISDACGIRRYLVAAASVSFVTTRRDRTNLIAGSVIPLAIARVPASAAGLSALSAAYA